MKFRVPDTPFSAFKCMTRIAMNCTFCLLSAQAKSRRVSHAMHALNNCLKFYKKHKGVYGGAYRKKTVTGLLAIFPKPLIMLMRLQFYAQTQCGFNSQTGSQP